MDTVDLEIREVLQRNGGQIPKPDSAAMAEIRRIRRSAGGKSDTSREISIREPVQPGVTHNRESTPHGDTITLKEGNVNSHTNTQLPTARQRYDSMVQSFMDMGLSEAGAREAARGRDPEPSATDTSTDALQEARRRGDYAKVDEINQARLIEGLKGMGMTDAQAKIAATPRGEYRYR